MSQRGILRVEDLPTASFDDQWDKIVVPSDLKDRVLAQAILNFTLRGRVSAASLPLHGIILLVGPPGTEKTSLARGLANRVARSLNNGDFHFIEVEPHSLASSALGRSQRAVTDLFPGCGVCRIGTPAPRVRGDTSAVVVCVLVRF